MSDIPKMSMSYERGNILHLGSSAFFEMKAASAVTQWKPGFQYILHIAF